MSLRLKNTINKRPLISHLNDQIQLKEFIKIHLFERSFYYEKSKIKVKTDKLNINDIVELITNILT